MQSIAIVVPVFNEEQAIAGTLADLRVVLHELPELEYEILCVDDGSTDATPQILAEQPDVTVLTHPVNRGYGAALRSALDYCDTEWVCIVDADGTYPLKDLGRLLAASPEADMVVGARQGPGITRNPAKRLARFVLRRMVQALTGVVVPDLNSGMRIFRHSLYRESRHLLPMGFSFTSTITVASLYAGHRVEYVPIHYAKRVGHSSIQPVRDFFRFSVLIVRLASYFEPLNFFLPLSGGILGLAMARGLRDLLVTNAIGSLAVLLALFALQMFTAGILADVVVRRSPGFRSRDATRQFVVAKKAADADERG